jgi:hypothetical protein
MMMMYNAALGQPGELAIAHVRNPLENPDSKGKPRPVVLVRRDNSRWFVMGLTTRRTYSNGAPRTPVPNPLAVGLDGPGYLWGDRLTAISTMDVDRHVGWVDAELAATIIVQARLDTIDATALIRATRRPLAAA